MPGTFRNHHVAAGLTDPNDPFIRPRLQHEIRIALQQINEFVSF